MNERMQNKQERESGNCKLVTVSKLSMTVSGHGVRKWKRGSGSRVRKQKKKRKQNWKWKWKRKQSEEVEV